MAEQKIATQNMEELVESQHKNYKQQISHLNEQIQFLNLTKTRYPKFIDKPELYGTHWEKLDDIPKLKHEVYNQAMINKARYYYTRTFQLERDLAEAKQ